MIVMERIDPNRAPWDQIDSFADRTIMQTKPWLDFIAATQKAEPVIAAVKEKERLIGYFTGLIVTKYGIRVLGSPFKGWASAYMGFNLPPGFSRRSALKALPYFAFEQLKCHYLEVVDRNLIESDCVGMGYRIQIGHGREIDLTQSESKLWADMSQKSCRWCINKSQKLGVVIEEANDSGFANDYYEQLKDVFANQSLVPPHGIERVQELIKYLLPTGNLLLLRARSPMEFVLQQEFFLLSIRRLFCGGPQAGEDISIFVRMSYYTGMR